MSNVTGRINHQMPIGLASRTKKPSRNPMLQKSLSK